MSIIIVAIIRRLVFYHSYFITKYSKSIKCKLSKRSLFEHRIMKARRIRQNKASMFKDDVFIQFFAFYFDWIEWILTLMFENSRHKWNDFGATYITQCEQNAFTSYRLTVLIKSIRCKDVNNSIPYYLWHDFIMTFHQCHKMIHHCVRLIRTWIGFHWNLQMDFIESSYWMNRRCFNWNHICDATANKK